MVWSVGLGRRRPILLLVVRTLALQALGGVLQFYRSTVVLRSGCEVDFGFKLYVVSGLLPSLSWRGGARRRPDGPYGPLVETPLGHRRGLTLAGWAVLVPGSAAVEGGERLLAIVAGDRRPWVMGRDPWGRCLIPEFGGCLAGGRRTGPVNTDGTPLS